MTHMNSRKISESSWLSALWTGGGILALVLWGALYSQLETISQWIVSLLPMEQTGRFHEAAVFFFYDICLTSS